MTSAPTKLEQPATWPGNVPSQSQALEVLRGRLTLAVSLPSARRLQEKLTQPEREALRVDDRADALCEALGVRWRLAAAQDLLLTAEGQVDPVALNALLAEVDKALEALRAATPSSPELGLAIDRTWEALTQEAVDFSSNVKAASAQPVAAPSRAPTAKKEKAATGKVTFQAEAPSQQAGQPQATRVLYAALAVAVIAVGAYHTVNMLQGQKQESNYPGAPPNTLVVPDPDNGSLLVQSTLSGSVTPEQQAWLKQLEAKGMQVKEMSPGVYLATPAPKAPATADNGAP